MDVLSDILSSVHLSGSILGRAEFGAPWGVSSEGLNDPLFHIVLSGNGFVSLEGEEPVPFATGDLIMMPHGHGHVLQSEQLVPTVRFTDLIQAAHGVSPGAYRRSNAACGGPAASDALATATA